MDSEEQVVRAKPNIKLSQILEMPLAFGNIYWLKEKSEGKIKIAYAGEPLNQRLLNKFNENHNFYIERIVERESFLTFKAKLNSFHSGITERSRLESMVNFLCLIKAKYYQEGQEESLLSLLAACYEVFQFEDFNFYEELFEFNTSLFRRSIRNAALAVAFAMASGYSDRELLKDFYNINFFSVYSFLKENNLKMTLAALEQERAIPGSLKEKYQLSDIDTFNKLTEEFESKIKNKTLKKYVKMPFEKLNGKGLPLGFSEDEMNDLESIFVFLSNSTTYNDFEFLPLDGKGYLYAMLKTEQALSGNFRIKRQLADRFEKLEPIEKSYLEMMA